MNRRDRHSPVTSALTDHQPGPNDSWSCFAALGDSFTAGTGCEPGYSWADRLAARLRTRNPGLLYRNFAVDGATSSDVLQQVHPALELEPDLVTVVCGGNDVLRTRRPDIEGYAARLDSIFVALQELPGMTIVTATAPTQWSFLGLGPRTARRVTAAIMELNEATREIARDRGVLCLEVAGHPALEDPANFSEDGLHPSVRGHARTARGFVELLEGMLGRDSGGREA